MSTPRICPVTKEHCVAIEVQACSPDWCYAENRERCALRGCEGYRSENGPAFCDACLAEDLFNERS